MNLRLDDSISGILSSYQDAWVRLDAAAIASHYADGADISDGDGERRYSGTELLNKFTRNCADLKRMQLIGAAWELSKQDVSSRSVNVIWKLSFPHAQIEFGTRYQLICDNGRTQFSTASVYPL